MVKPIDVMIVGAQKAGTSSLAKYLGGHPDICTHVQTEFTYFVRDEEYLLGYEHVFSKYFVNGCPHSSVLLAKNVGVMFLNWAVDRLKDHNPEVEVVVMLRDPVARAYSAYWWGRRMGYESLPTFEAALEAETVRLSQDFFEGRHTAYKARGLYAGQIKKLFEVFGREKVHVYLFEEFKNEPASVCARIFTNLGLDSTFVPNTSRVHNKVGMARSEALARFLVSSNPMKTMIRKAIPNAFVSRLRSALHSINRKEFSPPAVNPETKKRLAEFFKPHNDELARLLNMSLDCWSNP